MAITKTDFINYTKCPRYAALDNVYKEKLDSEISYQNYKDKENQERLEELVAHMYDEENDEEIDLIRVENKQLEAMMKYYKTVEAEAGRVATKIFGGKSTYAESTFNQECFDFSLNGIKYLCYVDIYNETEEVINIIEVKATTDKKYKNMMAGKKENKTALWLKTNNIYHLKDEIEEYPLNQEVDLEDYQIKRNKLFDRYGDEGKYIYDLAIQRFMIEGEYNSSKNPNITKLRFYLAVLNSEYCFDGTYIDGQANYQPDENGNELITFLDLTKITQEYQTIINQDAKKLENYLKELQAAPCSLGKWCGRKKSTECQFFQKICGSQIPKNNSVLNYINGAGFKINSDKNIRGLELINEGYLNLLDIPEEVITNENHIIQRNCLQFKTQYVNKDKIKAGLKALEYPIYHLDFETFPCPVPRFRGESPYLQSPFEFSLHIENKPGICDKEKDNFVFLAKTANDEREDLIKALINHIDGSKGTLFAQNVSFEKGRIKELATIFPQYKKALMNIYDRGFDLIWLLRSNTKLYQELGFDEAEAKIVNFYDADLSGSYSIKKTLPVFSDLNYANLEVKNGTEAIVEYANYAKMSKEEFAIKYQALVDYCQQDTWAMVVILDGLRKLVK